MNSDGAIVFGALILSVVGFNVVACCILLSVVTTIIDAPKNYTSSTRCTVGTEESNCK